MTGSDGQQHSPERRAYNAAIEPHTDEQSDSFVKVQARALMALCDAEFPVRREMVDGREVAVMNVSDAAVVVARFALTFKAPLTASSERAS